MIDVRFTYFADPKNSKARKHAAFRSTYSLTLDKLEYELDRLRATQIAIQAGFKREDIRNDGWPRGGSKPTHPAVVLNFTSNGKALSFPSDRHDTYHQNLHAIALTLEALRAVDRHGVTQGSQQYIGFAELAAPGESESVKWAAETILRYAGHGHGWPNELLNDEEGYIDVRRQALKRNHPDAGGNRESFEDVLRASAILDKHFEPKRQVGNRK